MQMDFKIFLLALSLCWLGWVNLEASPAINEEVAIAGMEVMSKHLFVENTSLSDVRPPRHYVVIGAFKDLKNASKLIRRVASVGLEPKYFLNKERRLYYVYIVIYDNIAAAFHVSSKLREVNFIKDAWVFSTEVDEPLSERFIASVEVKDSELLSDVSKEAPRKKAKPVASPPKVTSQESSAAGSAVKDSNPAPVERKKEPKEEPSENIFKPTSSKAINELVKADKGDVIIFEDLLFHKNSSVLRKVSKDEMLRLNDVLKKKTNLRIKIHGHTNGDFKGEVYLLAENDDRFFKLSGRNKVVKGDDKLLSAERARVIKRYLGSQGISVDRIETYGWGDRRMLYPKGHLKAPQNRRVEIEVLEN